MDSHFKLLSKWTFTKTPYSNKIRDLFKVKLYTIRSESKKKERETLNKRKREKKGERKKGREREREKKKERERLQINTDRVS